MIYTVLVNYYTSFLSLSPYPNLCSLMYSFFNSQNMLIIRDRQPISIFHFRSDGGSSDGCAILKGREQVSNRSVSDGRDWVSRAHLTDHR